MFLGNRKFLISCTLGIAKGRGQRAEGRGQKDLREKIDR